MTTISSSQNVNIRPNVEQLKSFDDTASTTQARPAHDDKKAQAALAALVTGQQAAPRGNAFAQAQTIELASPKVSAEAPKVAQEVMQGVEHEQEKQSHLSEDPGMAAAVGTLLQQFSAAPKPVAGTQDARQAERSGSVDPNSAEAASGSTHLLFGDGAQDHMFNVILKATEMLQESRQADVKMQGMMVQVSRAAAQSQADSMIKQGQDMMAGAVSGGVLQGAMATAGAVQQFRGLNTRAGSIENELKPAAEMRKFDSEQMSALRGKNKPMMSEDEVSSVDVKRSNGETASLSVENSGQQLSNEHAQVLSQEQPGRKHRMEMHSLDHQQNEITADRMRMTGSLIGTAGGIAKSQAEGIAGMEQNNDRATQTMAQNAEQVSSSDANARHESAQQMRDMMQKMHDLASQVNNNNAAVAGQIASNLKA
jgi:invasin C